MVYCVNDTRDEVKNITMEAKESSLMEMLVPKKNFEIFTCGYSESTCEERESYDVSLSLGGFETKWNMHEGDDYEKVMKYVKLFKSCPEYITYSLIPAAEVRGPIDVFVCKIHVKQKGEEDWEEDIKVMASTEFDIRWRLPDQLQQVSGSDQPQKQQVDAKYQTNASSIPVSPPLPPQHNPMSAEGGDQGTSDATGPHTVRTMEDQGLNQTHVDNQFKSLSMALTQGVAGALGQTLPNTGNTHITFNVQQVINYNPEKESMGQMEDVTTLFHKHIPPHVRKRLNETLSQDDVWNQVKKMHGISDETPRPHDIVSSLLSQVEGSIASFISVLSKLKGCHTEGELDIPQDLIDEVKSGLKSEMEYKKLRQNGIRFAEEIHIDIGRILNFFYQYDMIPDEEITVLRNSARENPHDACRKLFERLIASSPEKRPIECLKDALRQYQHSHLADELEVSSQDVEDELQKQEIGSDRPFCEEPLALGI
ncbi:uncharacterized protein LOC106159320 [Lingula anatina]|uniref:Uncharacterized protein LOC106159320 n=1 Tax=Lingula anatina TaxID=7574 RepID=A0A1S3I114_LINAN|nr:uncharacterized protein LOC106159320 [Lingula anatina]|eukprot:XP_013391034.1 uncharacterized protein LOC106159320 [Lingula anatina]